MVFPDEKVVWGSTTLASQFQETSDHLSLAALMRRGKVRQSAKFAGTIPGILNSPAALVGLLSK